MALSRHAGATPAALAITLLVLAACKPEPAPVVTLEGRVCVARPALDGAAPVELSGSDVKAVIDGNAACWQPAGEPGSAYVVFRLPQAADPYIVTIVSEPVGAGLIAPRAVLLDAAGEVRRELARDSFLSHGRTLKAGLRTRPGEAFLVVASDGASVGQNTSQLVSSTQQSGFMAGRVYVPIVTGSDKTVTQTYAHNGVVIVKAEPVPVLSPSPR